MLKKFSAKKKAPNTSTNEQLETGIQKRQNVETMDQLAVRKAMAKLMAFQIHLTFKNWEPSAGVADNIPRATMPLKNLEADCNKYFHFLDKIALQ
ncbi:hypothetical protein GH714_022013 [Hevea brasiliensis]|uniref:Uncharacterized protein n=1 Tax=Hevea brasiliensis TaxID=3981 RepID=A0A6A6KV00_HEVBR|nr:hypothetical protein GH714_022013 [Hevea brasiliensis]